MTVARTRYSAFAAAARFCAADRAAPILSLHPQGGFIPINAQTLSEALDQDARCACVDWMVNAIDEVALPANAAYYLLRRLAGEWREFARRDETLARIGLTPPPLRVPFFEELGALTCASLLRGVKAARARAWLIGHGPWLTKRVVRAWSDAEAASGHCRAGAARTALFSAPRRHGRDYAHAIGRGLLKEIVDSAAHCTPLIRELAFPESAEEVPKGALRAALGDDVSRELLARALTLVYSDGQLEHDPFDDSNRPKLSASHRAALS